MNLIECLIKKLCAFQNGLMELKEHIRLNSGELDHILKQSFTIDYNDFSHLEKETENIIWHILAETSMATKQTHYLWDLHFPTRQ